MGAPEDGVRRLQGRPRSLVERAQANLPGTVGGPYIYIHFIEGPAPAPLALPNANKNACRIGQCAFERDVDGGKRF
jgi:hypothetical protein